MIFQRDILRMPTDMRLLAWVLAQPQLQSALWSPSMDRTAPPATAVFLEYLVSETP